MARLSAVGFAGLSEVIGDLAQEVLFGFGSGLSRRRLGIFESPCFGFPKTALLVGEKMAQRFFKIFLGDGFQQAQGS
jgi:hypothetical protein